MSRRHYTDSARFSESLSHWIIEVRAADAARTERPPIAETVGRGLLLVADGVLRRYFRGQRAQWDDMQGYAVMVACNVLDRYDPEAGPAFPWCTTVIRNACMRYLQDEDAARFRALAYGRYMTDHAGARCHEFLADHQEHIEYHEQRLATLRATRAEKAQATAAKTRRSGKLTLPDGTQVTAAKLGQMLGMTSTKIYRRLDAGKTVSQIMTEAETAKTRRT